MRVVVVGASGNVGTSLLERLAGDPAVESVLGVARRRPPLDLGLLARVAVRPDPVARPALVDEAVLRAGRVDADRRRVDERRHTRVGDRAEDARGAVDVHAPQATPVARGLDQPREVDDGIGAAEQRHEIRRGHVPTRGGRGPIRQVGL